MFRFGREGDARCYSDAALAYDPSNAELQVHAELLTAIGLLAQARKAIETGSLILYGGSKPPECRVVEAVSGSFKPVFVDVTESDYVETLGMRHRQGTQQERVDQSESCGAELKSTTFRPRDSQLPT